MRRFCFPLFCAHQCVLGSLRPRVASVCGGRVWAECRPLLIFTHALWVSADAHAELYLTACSRMRLVCFNPGLRRGTTASAGSARLLNPLLGPENLISCSLSLIQA